MATAQSPGATQIVDLYHACGHLHDLARKLEFVFLDRRGEWLAARLEDHGSGDIDRIVTATASTPSQG